MRNLNRTRALTILRWSKVSDVKRNVKFMIDPRDHIILVLDRHGQVIDEMRKVRNRIAHNSGAARQGYAIVVRRRYGARVRAVTPGSLLLSPRWRPTILEEYLRSAATLVKEVVGG